MARRKTRSAAPGKRDVLILVDVQRDFLPGGSLAVPDGSAVVPVLNGYLERFTQRGLPVFATRDWHPRAHCSFREQGGPWPPHCVADTVGAGFAAELQLPPDTTVINKGTDLARDAYSGFEGTDLKTRLEGIHAARLYIGGLATDYCVRHTVLDALRLGFPVLLLEDACRAVNVAPDDGARALDEMRERGAVPVTLERLP